METIMNKHPEQEVRSEVSLEDQIARRAHALWEAGDCPYGADLQHWLRAEAEIMGEVDPSPSNESPERS